MEGSSVHNPARLDFIIFNQVSRQYQMIIARLLRSLMFQMVNKRLKSFYLFSVNFSVVSRCGCVTIIWFPILCIWLNLKIWNRRNCHRLRRNCSTGTNLAEGGWWRLLWGLGRLMLFEIKLYFQNFFIVLLKKEKSWQKMATNCSIHNDKIVANISAS